jgi:Predicted membrane protein (DUF2079).
MLLARLRSLPVPPVFIVAAVAGLLLWSILPSGVVAFSDDFGYLRSTIETLQRGRPWTDDWLEPWAASLSVASALLYRITGSFQFAVHGVQILAAAATAAAAFLLLLHRELSSRRAALVTALLATSPTLLWQLVDFTSMLVYAPCLLLALWTAERRQWTWFVLFSLIGLASRQSALTWTVLPACAAIAAARNSTTRRPWLAPTVASLALIGGFLVLAATMNPTHSQSVITAHLFEHLQPARASQSFLSGLVVWSVFTGIGALVLGWNEIARPASPLHTTRTLLVVTLGAIVFLLLDTLPPIFAGHRSFDGSTGALYRHLCIAAGLAGWILFRIRFRWDFALCALASLSLVSLRSELWDYYLLDVALLAFFGVIPRSTGTAPEKPSLRPATSIALLVFGILHFTFAYGIKTQVDRARAACVLAEHAIRDGRLDVTDLAAAPFGFIGWHLHAHYKAHDGQHSSDIGGFMRYLRPASAEFRQSPTRFWRDSRSLRPLDDRDASRVIVSDVFRVGWIWNQRLSLLSSAGDGDIPGPLLFDRTTCQPRRFPLDDHEWRTHIAAP